ncbi:MAG: ATPase [Spirulinaceae cyanobacterium RM2_2_10]|nr:ATPase [Spirulinaceae cyanobacterium RM2_2_10]
MARTICSGFLAVIAVGMLLLMLPIAASDSTWTSPIIALFTATSAVCVTGLIVVDTGTHFSFFGQLVILLLIQVGGLGYMTSSTFLILLVRRRFDVRQKFAIQESFDGSPLQGSRNLIRSIIAMTLLFELTGTLILLRVFVPKFGFYGGLWQSLFHSISAWNNAGFSLFANSLTDYQNSWVINLIIPGLVIFGGIGYQVIIELYFWLVHLSRRQHRHLDLSLNFKVVTSTTAVLLVLGTLAFLFTEFSNSSTLEPLTNLEKLGAAWFQSVTTRTAGFNTIDFGRMSDTMLFITIGLMLVGASPSGTGGGMKTTTVRILLNCTRSTLRGIDQVVMYNRRIPTSVILRAVTVALGSMIVVVWSTFLLSLTEANQFEFIDLLFEAVSAFATVGLSTGITSNLSALGELIITLTMFVGRVGILIFIGAILGDRRPTSLQYPEENLLVG